MTTQETHSNKSQNIDGSRSISYGMRNFQFSIFNFQRKRNSASGFTLIELMTSVAVFLIVVVISMGSILGIFDANRKSRSLKSVMSNLNLSIETMSKEIRYGSSYHCGDGVEPNCPSGDDSFTFRSSEGEQITYHLNGTTIEKDVDGGGFAAITAPEVIIDKLTFYTVGAGTGNTLQAKTIILVRGHAGQNEDESQFTLQTLASQRIVDNEETIPPPEMGSYTIEYLMVGGGGGGGAVGGPGGGDSAGGGGGGGVVVGSSSVVPGSASVAVTVGPGGAPGVNGSNSSIAGINPAIGGGRGGSFNVNGGSGGSGGGGGGDTDGDTHIGGGGTAGQGNTGGSGATFSGRGGGGGGAIGVGSQGGGDGGTGGAGRSNDYSGSAVVYGGGGGGGGGVTGGVGGAGGGHGASSGAGTNATPGINGLGGGGGGGTNRSNEQIPGAAGGSGIVIIRHPSTIVSSCNGSCSSNVLGGFRIHTFTGDGTFLP